MGAAYAKVPAGMYGLTLFGPVNGEMADGWASVGGIDPSSSGETPVSERFAEGSEVSGVSEGVTEVGVLTGGGMGVNVPDVT